MTAPAGDVLLLESVLSDPDNLLVDYNLYYRTPGAEEFILNEMSVNADAYTSYFATISGEEMTSAGIEYYIEMSYYVSAYDKLYTHRLPETDCYTIMVTETAVKAVTGDPQSTHHPVYHYDADASSGALSPVSP